MTETLFQKVSTAFSNIISRFNLVPKKVNNDFVLLVGIKFSIGILLDRDGLNFMYYDFLSGRGYNLGLYLINKRRESLSFVENDKSDKPLDEYLSHSLEVFARHLNTGGQDILSGEKEWIKQYSWASFNLTEELRELGKEPGE